MKKLEFETETFAVLDDRDNPYEWNRGISIVSGHGDGLYNLNLEKLRELREVVDRVIQALELEKCE